MRRLLLLGLSVFAALSLGGVTAFASARESCDGPISGVHRSVTVTGTCVVAGDLTINGTLTLTNGSVFGGFGAAVHVNGNIDVGKGAQLALGYNAAEGTLGPDVVNGNIFANQPLALYLGNTTVHGSVTSIGGGSSALFYNFPIKDNVIDGNLTILGWTGGWWGVVANTINGNVLLVNNRSVVHPADEDACQGTFPAGCAAAHGADDDAAEVQSRFGNPQHISGTLLCFANTPSAQVNPLDGGDLNIVDHHAFGECANLVAN